MNLDDNHLADKALDFYLGYARKQLTSVVYEKGCKWNTLV